MESLQTLINTTLANEEGITDTQKMFLSILAEMDEKFRLQLVKYALVYKISLTPVQAFALRLLYVNCPTGNKWFDNELRRITDRVHQQYS